MCIELLVTFCLTRIISKGYLRTRNCQKEWREEASEKGNQGSEAQQLLKRCSTEEQF